jgi:hypothetical protein
MKARLHAQMLKAAADGKGGLAAEATVVAAEAMAALEEASKQAEDATASAEAGASGPHGEVNSTFFPPLFIDVLPASFGIFYI